MDKKQMKITNRSQFEALVCALEENLEVARGHGKSGTFKANIKQFWVDLSIKLNSLGPPMRDGPAWLKVWNDQKYLVKQKLQHNKQQFKGTGGGQNTTLCLSKVEESIANILNLEVAVNPQGSSFGIFQPPLIVDKLNAADEPDIAEDDYNDEYAQSQVNNKVTRRNKSQKEKTTKIEEERLQLLKKQTVVQKSILREHRDTNRYLRKMVKIKEEQLENKKSYQQNVLKIKKNKS